MQFRTEIQIPPAPVQFSRTKGFFTLGSCFAEVMGHNLKQVKANALVNPFGTIFNPLSANKLLRAAAHNDASGLPQGLVQRQGLWFHYDFHSAFHSPDPDALLSLLADRLQKAHLFLHQAQVLLLTWGTAYGYERADTGGLVANCHKMPQKYFRKRLFSLDEIVQDTTQTLAELQECCPALQVILTVSPVRHLKDSLALNSVSKSILRVAAHQLEEKQVRVTYFPAYELLLDDLRDYRFYSADLLHPSDMAEKYIWEKFWKAYTDKDFYSFIECWAALQRDLNHRPFHLESPEHQKFLRHLLTRLQEISLEADVQDEIHLVQKQLLT